MGDISGRRGEIICMDSDAIFQLIKAQIPQAELHNYSTTVRSMAGGRGLYSEVLSHYGMMPKEIEKVIVKNRAMKVDE